MGSDGMARIHKEQFNGVELHARITSDDLGIRLDGLKTLFGNHPEFQVSIIRLWDQGYCLTYPDEAPEGEGIFLQRAAVLMLLERLRSPDCQPFRTWLDAEFPAPTREDDARRKDDIDKWRRAMSQMSGASEEEVRLALGWTQRKWSDFVARLEKILAPQLEKDRADLWAFNAEVKLSRRDPGATLETVRQNLGWTQERLDHMLNQIRVRVRKTPPAR